MLLNPFALEVEATCKREDYERLAARDRAGRAVTPTRAATVRPDPWTGLRATAVAAREGLAAVGARLRAFGWVPAARRRPAA